ncbi:MAG: low molecular weight phosphotyrosine protein phosphatase [Clostridia bacterium]|nr:low molecular weight phosphotyrosine protein phosphatase [Clostridia bacterium]
MKILFVCLGNICRSPMAEFVMKDLVRKEGTENLFEIASGATSSEQVGNPVYPNVKKLLTEHGIDCSAKRAYQLQKQDYDKYDMLICMDENNLRNMKRICGEDKEGKMHLLMEFTGSNAAVADPYYTRDFDTAWNDINKGCRALYNHIMENKA